MAAITTRQTAGTGATVAGVPLTNAQLDANFINLNTAVVDAAANTAVTPGAYTSTNLTVDSRGRITAATSGAAGGVTSFSAGSTGFTPSTTTTGVVTLSGTLAVASGGTGTTTPALVQGTNVTITGTWPNQTINASSSGTVTAVTGTAPVVSSGGATPAISIPVATTSVSGYLSSTDWTTFNAKQAAGSYLTAEADTLASVTARGATTTVVPTFSKGLTAGSSVPFYHLSLDFGGDAAGSWRVIGTVALANSTYSTAAYKITITDPNANHGTTGSINADEYTYYVACVRTENVTIDTPDACVVNGPYSHIRAVKTSLGNYQIQVSNEQLYQEYLVTIQCYANNFNANAITFLDGTTAGGAGIAVYTASVGTATSHFQKINTLGGATINGNTVIAVTDNTNAALRITQLGTGNALLVEDSTNPDATPFVVRADGSFLIGSTTPFAGSITPKVEFMGASPTDAALGLYTFNTTSSGPTIEFGQSNNATIGAQTIVASGDSLGVLRFSGSDGTGLIRGAQIVAAVDGTPGTNDMPGRLVFSTTADGASSPTERMRINSTGNLLLGRTYSGNETIGIGGSSSSVSSATSASGIFNDTIVSATQTNTYTHNGTYISTAAAGFNLTNLKHNSAGQFTIGAGSSITNQYGFLADSSLTGATNNYGFYGNIASGTGRYNLYMAGTANNYLAGNLGIGTTSPGSKLTVAGQIESTLTGFKFPDGTTQATAATGANWTKITTTTTATTKKQYVTDTTAGAFTVTLPASPAAGDYVYFMDAGNWATNNLTVARNGSTIEASATDLVLDVAGLMVQLIYDGSTWQVMSNIGPQGPVGPVGVTGAAGLAGTPALNIVTTTTQLATAYNQYVLTNVAVSTLTLPVSPIAGDVVWVTPGNGLFTNVMARNGNNIMGVAEDMTMNNASANYQMRYINATLGWRIM